MISQTGFKVEYCAEVDSLGFFAWLFLKVFKPGINETGSLLLPIYDKFIWPWSKNSRQIRLSIHFEKNLLSASQKILILAEDKGFEPLRDCSQLTFQASAIGH